MPVAGVAGQSGYLQAHHNAGTPQAHLGDQTPEPFAIRRELTRLALIRVNDDHLLDRPAERHGTLAQPILTFGTLDILKYLTRRGLTHVQIGIPLEVPSLHL